MTLEEAFDCLTEFVIVMFFLSLRFIAYPFLLIGAAVEKSREERGKIKRKTMKVWCDARCVPANKLWKYPTTEHEIEIPGFFTQMVDLDWQETRHKKACPGYAQRSWEKKGFPEPKWGCEVPKRGDD